MDTFCVTTHLAWKVNQTLFYLQEVPVLFSDNFDCQSLDEFVKGTLENDLTDHTIYVHSIEDESYAARRVKSRSSDKIKFVTIVYLPPPPNEACYYHQPISSFVQLPVDIIFFLKQSEMFASVLTYWKRGYSSPNVSKFQFSIYLFYFTFFQSTQHARIHVSDERHYAQVCS